MRLIPLTVLMTALAFSTTASAGPKISTDVAPGVNVGSYRTYSWVDAPIPAGINPIIYQRVQANVDSALAQKGYQKASSGQLSLILSLGARDKTDVQSWGGVGWGWRGWGGNRVDVWQYTEGQLTLDVFDTTTKQAVWHGQATDTINPNKPRPDRIDAAVAKVMARFPAMSATMAPTSVSVPPPASNR